MLWALHHYGYENKQTKYWISEALTYERSFYSKEVNNWPDFRIQSRPNSLPVSFMTAWCYGATGIGLARLSMLKSGYMDSDIENEIDIAISTTARNFGDVINMCHGDSGKLELFLQAHVHGFISFEKLLDYSSFVINYIEKNNVLAYESVGDVFIPGLLTGAAGVAYQFMRLAYPNKVPSVLLLEDPYEINS